MKFKFFSLSLLLVLGIFMFTACQKENIDIEKIEEENVNPQIVVCNLTGTIAEQPPGSGDLFTAVNGATPPLTYLWSTGETTANISVASDGLYAVTITDADSCFIEEEVTISTSDPCLVFTTTIEEGNTIGGLILNTNGGTPPYTYDWSTGENTASITVTMNGVYAVTITDASGCVTGDEFSVSTIDPCQFLTATAESDPAGVLITNITGGTAPYTYSWSTGETSSSITPMIDGTYTVTITDANGCVVEATVTINSAPCNDLLIFIDNPQAFTLITGYSGGTPPYTFLWSTGATTSSISAPGSGTYSVTITDVNGCTAENQITL
ncbi:MAG: hypothetical protein AB8G15_10600 [Saprospiraceae bacterium]